MNRLPILAVVLALITGQTSWAQGVEIRTTAEAEALMDRVEEHVNGQVNLIKRKYPKVPEQEVAIQQNAARAATVEYLTKTQKFRDFVMARDMASVKYLALLEASVLRRHVSQVSGAPVKAKSNSVSDIGQGKRSDQFNNADAFRMLEEKHKRSPRKINWHLALLGGLALWGLALLISKIKRAKNPEEKN